LARPRSPHCRSAIPREIGGTADDTNYGLAAGIWTGDVSKAHRMAAQLRAGTVWVNCYNIFDASLPFGGYMESGWGREMGHEALHNEGQHSLRP
jgi:phenylacetaldehyde dehydrogenase